MAKRDLTAPEFIAGKARFLCALTGSWSGAFTKALWYAETTDHRTAKTMWSAVAAHIHASRTLTLAK